MGAGGGGGRFVGTYGDKQNAEKTNNTSVPIITQPNDLTSCTIGNIKTSTVLSLSSRMALGGAAQGGYTVQNQFDGTDTPTTEYNTSVLTDEQIIALIYKDIIIQEDDGYVIPVELATGYASKKSQIAKVKQYARQIANTLRVNVNDTINTSDSNQLGQVINILSQLDSCSKSHIETASRAILTAIKSRKKLKTTGQSAVTPTPPTSFRSYSPKTQH